MKKTKSEVLQEFMHDLQELVDRIERKEESRTDYNKLQELFELSNVPDNLIRNCYEGCGFDSWNDFYDERRKNQKIADKKKMACCMGKIRGTASAIISQMTTYLQSNK